MGSDTKDIEKVLLDARLLLTVLKEATSELDTIVDSALSIVDNKKQEKEPNVE